MTLIAQIVLSCFQRDIISKPRTGSSTGLYSFGELTISETEDIKAFKIDGKDTFSSSEMQLSIHDDREPPIGWSSWDPKQGSDLVAGGLCKRDCTTGAQTVERTRYCRCVPEGSTTEINDQDDVDAFNAGCQPCIGARTQTDTCEIADCGIPTQTASTPEYYHHGCCEKSTAIRVMGLNEDGNNLGLNGVYELVYQDEDKNNHKYAYLGDANIVIERQIVNNVATNWVFKRDGNIEHESGRIIGSDPSVADLYHPAQCPVDAGGWTVYGTVQPYPAELSYLAVSCSTGRNTCPLTHPYSFNKGKKCCASPFMHSGTNVALSGKLLTPYDDDPEGIVTDNVGNIPLETDVSCLGHWINCPHMDTTKYSRTIRCRTNLKSPGNFKATQSGVYAYGYVLCTNHCNTVYLESTPEN